MNPKIKQKIDEAATELANASDIFAHTRATSKLVGICDALEAVQYGSKAHLYALNAVTRANKKCEFTPTSRQAA